MITFLSEEIYPILRSYLIYDDYLCLINTSKKDFLVIKRNTIYLELTWKYSMVFLTNENNFQQQIHSLVASPSKQICIKVKNFECLAGLCDLEVHRIVYDLQNTATTEHTYTSLPLLPNVKEVTLNYNFNKILDVSSLRHLHAVTLISCTELVDISPLRDVPNLSIVSCCNVNNFQTLGKQKKLNIFDFDNRIDLSPFSKIIELSLEQCSSLSDISPLKNIPILSICYCPSIRDLSPLLGSHKSLTINHCQYELEGYDSLQNIPIVDLRNCNITNVEVLKDAKSIQLFECNNLVDVSPLSCVKRIHLENCQQIEDLSPLAQVPELFISKLPRVRNAHLLRNMHLKIKNSQNDSANLLDGSNPRYLLVSGIVPLKALRDIANLNHLLFLSIEEVAENFSTVELTHIPTVHLNYCRRLTGISGLGRNREVRLFNCPLIRDVSSLRTVPIVNISGCGGITDYSCLANVPRLRISERCGPNYLMLDKIIIDIEDSR